MKKTDKISYRQKSVAELQKLLSNSKKNLVESRMKFHTGNQKDTSIFKKIKYEIVYILTLLKEKENEK
ncbi:MAG: 50S ribosomal protein L29 [Candidatus Shapirobacteria bacterium]|nr:50S ribosomal protein L29 [Candidatus Shapirobacteria bacterium]